VERKGIGNAISAIAGVPACELVIAGGPERSQLDADPEAERYRRLARELGVADRVHLLGSLPRDRVPALLRSADLVACVPWYEPFGMVALEAMACGVPVIASAVGGLVDTVVDGVTGIHVPPRQPSEIARVIRWLLADPRRRRQLGRAGSERAVDRYGWDQVAADTVYAYSPLLGGEATGFAQRAR
jgi:glycosyltransferase involved in cell wall biosynthesis